MKHDTCLDASTFVVLGDGLAAGMGHFSLEGAHQATSFPALLAAALGTELRQPLMQPPGLGDVIGLEPRPVIVPEIRQSTVLTELPQASNLGNLSVPGFSFADALELTPRAPLVRRDSSRHTLANFILGLPDLEQAPDRGRTQVAYALDRNPTLILTSLGFDQMLQTATTGCFDDLHVGRILRHSRRLLSSLRDGAQQATLVLTTIPDPLDGAYFSTLQSAARILKTTPDFLLRHWGFELSDRIPLPALYAMGYQTMARQVGTLPEAAMHAHLDRLGVAKLRSLLAELNEGLRQAARAVGAGLFDLHGVLAGVARDGVETEKRRLTADYLGGLYLLNGAYPGPTLNAVVARSLGQFLASHYPLRRPLHDVPVDAIAAQDANTLCQLAPGPPTTDAFLRPRTTAEMPSLVDPSGPVQEPPIQTTYPALQPGKGSCTPAVGIPAAGLADPSRNDPGFQPLVIPPQGLDYTLDLNTELSCFGDALRAVDCPGEPSLLPGFPPFGLCENVFFGGFLPTTSPLSGKIQVIISPPDSEGRCRFEIRHPGGLQGSDGDLVGPQLFRMPVQGTRVRDLPGLPSTGLLDTSTGRVYNFHYNLQNTNTALSSLLKLNPHLPSAVRETLLTFPGQPNAGSSWAELTPRSDGLFDISISAHMFVPLGAGSAKTPLRFALPFTTPDLQAASFVARGTSLHPRIFLTTRPTPSAGSQPAALPENTVVEMTAESSRTFFGDDFTLRAAAFGDGGAVGRSLLLGRIKAQFGAHTGDTVPVVFQILPPGGLLGEAPTRPPFLPPGTSRGGAGFNRTLHFQKLSYPQSGLSSPDDPLNVCTTSLHIPTGRPVGPLLWRGFVVQALFKELIQVEPCTPADSFNYQGPMQLSQQDNGALELSWDGTVFLPYPKGFLFPSPGPGGQPAITIEGDSRLDPFRGVRAVAPTLHTGSGRAQGELLDTVSPATGDHFSCRWSIPLDGSRAEDLQFEYVNHTQGGNFDLTSVSWIDIGNGVGLQGTPSHLLTFSGFGIWSLAPASLHQVSVQISTDARSPYVGIQVNGGVVSNVDLEPVKAG